MTTRDDHVLTLSSGTPTPPTDEARLVADDLQVALIGDTPDGLAQQGGTRPEEDADPTGR